MKHEDVKIDRVNFFKDSMGTWLSLVVFIDGRDAVHLYLLRPHEVDAFTSTLGDTDETG